MTDHTVRATAKARDLRAAALGVLCAAVVGGCAQLGGTRDQEPESPTLAQARETYVRCINAEAAKDAANPAGAEDIAVAAHGRCWASWDAYRQAANRSYASAARTREEHQLAHDKADAHLRQFEQETRRSVVDGIVQRTLTGKP